MKKGYVAGKFRAPTNWDIKQHIRNAEKLALALWRTGKVAAYCPHLNSAEFQDAAPDAVWLEGHLVWLRASDFVLVVPGWEKSSGTKAEIAEAERLGIPVFYASSISDDPIELVLAHSLTIEPGNPGYLLYDFLRYTKP